MGGLGAVGFAPLHARRPLVPGRSTVTTDQPALACLGSQYAGWRLDRDDYFAMASGPGRALDPRRGPLRRPRRRRAGRARAVLCLETRDAAAGGDRRLRRRARRRRARRRSRSCSRRPRASPAASRSPRASSRPRCTSCTSSTSTCARVVSGVRELPAAAGGAQGPRRDRAHERRGALRRPGRADGRRAATTSSAELVRAAAVVGLATTTASRSARCSRPPTGTSTRSTRCSSAPPRSGSSTRASGRSFHAGGVDLDVLDRSFGG